MNQARANDQSSWIVSPVFDLFFFINIWWIIVAFWPQWELKDTQDTTLTFWQVYFITTPHRWITLFLVATDPDRRGDRSKWFVVMAIGFAAFIGLVWGIQGKSLVCLAAIDFVWNAWHFGAQHGGILRIYSRKSDNGHRWLELNSLRIFVTYVFLRTGGAFLGWLELRPQMTSAILILDLVVAALPASLVVMELFSSPHKKPGKVLYLLSVFAMYTAVLIACRSGNLQFLIPLTVASAGFHSVEYMAILTYYARRRKDHGTPALFQTMAKYWLRFMAVFMLFVGFLAVYFDSAGWQWFAAANLWAAYLHYGYDGMIWKLRRSETAQSLGVDRSANRSATTAG